MIEPSEQQTPQWNLCPYVNVSFALSGKQLPADHGYLVYSAISRSTSSLHGIDWLAIELISGLPSGRGLIALSERDATLRLRIPANHYRDVLPLAGKRLDIGGHQIRLGLPVARSLEPAPSLYARVVTIKKFTEPEPFLEAVKRKLDSFGVKGRVELPRDEQGRYRAFRLVERLSAITECRDFSQPTFHNHNPIAQRLLRLNQNSATSNVESTRKCNVGGWMG